MFNTKRDMFGWVIKKNGGKSRERGGKRNLIYKNINLNNKKIKLKFNHI